MILDKNDKKKVQEYISFVENYDTASLMQSYGWAKVKKGWDSEYVYIEREGKIIAACSLIIRKFALGKTLMYAPRGPVCNVYDIDIVKELIKDIDVLAKKHKAFAFRFDPELKYSQDLEKLYKENGFKVRNRKCSKDDLIQPRFNMILSLDGKTEDEIFSSYSEKTRYNIRLAGRKGVTVRYSRDEEDVKIMHELYKITAARDKIGGRNLEYFLTMLEVFDENHLRVYVAEHEKTPLSAAIAIKHGNKMFYLYGASSNEKRNLMPNYIMQQEMIKWAVECGCTLYDFGGVFEFTKENGLYKFKEGFCRKDGVTEFIGEFDKVYNKFVYMLFDKLVPFYTAIRKKINKIIKR